MNKKTIKNKCDVLWGQVIRSKGYCEYCGSSSYLNAHHVIGRTIYILRFDLRNGCCLCAGCHFMAHNNPVKFLEWFKSVRPKDYEFIKNPIHENVKPWRVWDYEDIYQKLREVTQNERF